MAGKINPTTLRWQHDGKNVDESDFDSTRFGGWEVEINGAAVMSVPLGWETDGQYEAPIADLGLEEGDYTLRVRLVTTDPQIRSDWSEPTTVAIRKVPKAPFGLVAE